MFICTRRSFVVLVLCIWLLAFHPREVFGSRSGGFLLQRGLIKNHRTLMAAEMNGLDTEKKSETARVESSFDPNQSSKRKVRRGSDPIHNRT
ncbi:hypothetical protein ACP275_12G104700 [Erythranthe tilingii]